MNFVEAVPSAAAWARAVPAIAALRPGFTAPGAVILPGASANPDFDIAQLQETQDVTENSFSGRLDFQMNDNWSAYVRVFHDQGTSDRPEGVTGRVVSSPPSRPTPSSTSRGCSAAGAINEFKVGYNARPEHRRRRRRQAGLREHLRSTSSGSVANTGIAGQSGNSGIAGRAAWSASTARATAAARPTIRTR